MLDCQGLPSRRPNERYDINFFQRCSNQGNRRMHINKFCMLKPMSLSCMLGDEKRFFSSACLILLRYEKEILSQQ